MEDVRATPDGKIEDINNLKFNNNGEYSITTELRHAQGGGTSKPKPKEQ